MSAIEPISDREYFDRILEEQEKRFDRLLQEIVLRMDERSEAAKEAVTAAMTAADTATKAAFAAAEKATDKAFDAASTLAMGHNDLLRKMERLVDTFATKTEVESRFGRVERFQAALGGGMILASFVGIANLVKVWG